MISTQGSAHLQRSARYSQIHISAAPHSDTTQDCWNALFLQELPTGALPDGFNTTTTSAPPPSLTYDKFAILHQTCFKTKTKTETKVNLSHLTRKRTSETK